MKEKKHHISLEENTSYGVNILMLAIAQIVVKVLGLVYKIVIVNIPGFGDQGNGYYSTGYQLYMILLAISSIGIPNVVSKLVSERVAIGDYIGAHKAFKICLNLMTFVGFVLALGMFAFAKPISIALYGDVGVAYTLMALSPAVMLVATNSVLRGYFTGLGSLKSTSASEIIEQFFNCTLSILFVVLAIGQKTAIMAAMGNLSTTCAIIISLAYMGIFYFNRRKYIKLNCSNQLKPTEDNSIPKLTKTIVLLIIPSAFASLVSSLSSNIDSVTITHLAKNGIKAFGLISKTETITHMPLALSATLYIAIVPVIAAFIKKNEIREAQKKLSNTVLISNLIIFPCAAGLIVLANSILQLLYPTAPEGAFLLQLQTIAMLFSAMTYILNGVYYGLGKQVFSAVILLIGTVLKFIMNVVFIKYFGFGAVGAVVATIIYQALVTLAEYILINRLLPTRMNIQKVYAKPMIASVIMAVIITICKYICNYLNLQNIIGTMAVIIIGGIAYFALLLMMHTLDTEDYLTLPKGALILKIVRKLPFTSNLR